MFIAIAAVLATGPAQAQGISAQGVLAAHPSCAYCHKISCSQIVKDQYGTRTWRPGNVNFGSHTLRLSHDGHCYGCWYPKPIVRGTVTIGMCLIVPKRMW
jgi:hypothetical protein